MFRTVPLSIFRSFSLYTQQWYMSYRFSESLRAVSGQNRVPSWSCCIPSLCVQWKTPDDGQRNCPNHVEFYSKNKLQKLVHLTGFIIKSYHDTRSPERQVCQEWVELYTYSPHAPALRVTEKTFTLSIIKNPKHYTWNTELIIAQKLQIWRRYRTLRLLGPWRLRNAYFSKKRFTKTKQNSHIDTKWHAAEDIIIYLLTATGLSLGGSDYFTCKQNMKSVTTEFKSGGLHEKHVVATWNLGNHLSICRTISACTKL
jgi:hypothetical protein